MSESKTYKHIRNKFFTLLRDQTELGIVTALHWYKSLNLKKIAQMINKPESTSLRYIRKLKDDGIIVFDSEKSEDSWGKFYKLSPESLTIYEEYMNALNQRIETVADDLRKIIDEPEENIKKYVASEILSPAKLEEIPAIQNYFYFVSNLQNIMINETVEHVNDIAKVVEKQGLEEVKEKIQISPMDVSIYVNDIKLSTWKHVLRINEVIFEFLTKLNKLRQDIEDEMDKEKVPEEERLTQFVNLFTGSLDVSYTLDD